MIIIDEGIIFGRLYKNMFLLFLPRDLVIAISTIVRMFTVLASCSSAHRCRRTVIGFCGRTSSCVRTCTSVKSNVFRIRFWRFRSFRSLYGKRIDFLLFYFVWRNIFLTIRTSLYCGYLDVTCYRFGHCLHAIHIVPHVCRHSVLLVMYWAK